MQKFGVFILIVVVVGAFSNCRSTKKIQTAISKKDSVAVVVPDHDSHADSMQLIRDVYAAVRNNQIQFNTFSAKVKVNFEGSDGKKSDFNAFIRLQKDSVLWVSINAVLGIEAFRIMITRDSVKVLNKLDKVVQLRSVSFLQEVVKIPLTFHDVQELIVGNPIYLDSSNIISYKKDQNTITLNSIGTLFKHLLTVSNPDYRLLNSKLDDINTSRARTALLTYGDYQDKNGIQFSTARKITVSEKSVLNIEMQFKQFDFNEQLNFPFTVPKNYKSN
jgi:hypothetical protein